MSQRWRCKVPDYDRSRLSRVQKDGLLLLRSVVAASQVFKANSLLGAFEKRLTCLGKAHTDTMSSEHSSSCGSAHPMTTSGSSVAEDTPESEHALSVLDFAHQYAPGTQQEVRLDWHSYLVTGSTLCACYPRLAYLSAVPWASFKQT